MQGLEHPYLSDYITFKNYFLLLCGREENIQDITHG